MEDGFTIRRVHPVRNYLIFACVLALIVGGIFGIQGIQTAQAGEAQAQSLKASQAKLVAAKVAATGTAAREDLSAAIQSVTPVLASVGGRFVPTQLNDAINAARTLLALQEDNPEKLAAAAAAIKAAAEAVPAAVVEFDAQQAAENAKKQAQPDAQKVAEPKVSVRKQAAAPRSQQVSVSPHPIVKPSAPAPAATTADLLAGAQAALRKLGGGDTVSLASDFREDDTCRAHARRGAPQVTFEYCWLIPDSDTLYALMAHEWVHTKTNPLAVLPDALTTSGVAAAEMVADCYAMARLHAGAAPGGYMTSCTPEQTAASVQAIEHPVDVAGNALPSLLP